jgi:hypothetical protein
MISDFWLLISGFCSFLFFLSFLFFSFFVGVRGLAPVFFRFFSAIPEVVMAQSNHIQPTAARVNLHRQKLLTQGTKRVTVIVPIEDADWVRELAARLGVGGDSARQLREQVSRLLEPTMVSSWQALVDFFRTSPLIGEELIVECDRSPGRPVDL